MKNDTVIDPRWEEEQQAREREEELVREASRRVRRRRDTSWDEADGPIAPWDEPREQPHANRARRYSDDTQRPSWEPAPETVAADEEPPYEEPREEDGVEQTPPVREHSKIKEYIGGVLSGNILSKAEVRRLYPYMLFLAFLALLYISNVFRMQQLHHRHERLAREVKELRAKSLTIQAMRVDATRRSRIVLEVEGRGLGLRESLTPPKVIKE